MKGPVYLWLCSYCKNNVIVFPVKTLNPNFILHKCDCCGKKRPCQTFKMISKGDQDEHISVMESRDY